MPLTLLHREPVPSYRLNFNEVSKQLSLPDTRLLKWSEEDKSANYEVATIRGDLKCALNLYVDLQLKYQSN